jgi:hypothetical protein
MYVSDYWPADYKDRVESDLLADLARQAHLAGGQFAAWPTVEHREEKDWDRTLVEMKVWVIPRAH